MQNWVLKIWKYEETFQDMEGLVLNCEEFPVYIRDMELFRKWFLFRIGKKTCKTIGKEKKLYQKEYKLYA